MKLSEKYDGFIFDIDGVVLRGKKPIGGSVETINKLQKMGKKVTFFTNNSSKTAQDCTDKLKGMGVEVSNHQVITSAHGTAVYLKQNYKTGRVFVIGEKGLIDEITAYGFQIVDNDDADFVVVGVDKSFTYEKLRIGMSAIAKGAKFIATNTDKRYPKEDRMEPGAGAMVAALSACAMKEPDVIIGKPESHVLELSLIDYTKGRSNILMVGDRLDTDVEFGNKHGMGTLLVLTGDTDKIPEKFLPNQKPTYVLNSVKDIFTAEI